MDIVKPFPKTVQGNRHILVITDRYFKLTWVVLTSKTTATQVTTLSMGFWLIHYGTSAYLLPDNRTYLVN